MKRFVILVVVVSVLAGCNAWVSGATVNLAQYACRNEGGISDINTALGATVTCNSGNEYILADKKLKEQYVTSLRQIKSSEVE